MKSVKKPRGGGAHYISKEKSETGELCCKKEGVGWSPSGKKRKKAGQKSNNVDK